MKDESANLGGPSADCCNCTGHGTANPEPGILGASGAVLPPVVDRVAFESELNRLRVREKARLAGAGGAGQGATGTVPADAACDASAGAVRFGVLGPLLVADDAVAARAVSAAGLAEALWDASPPPKASAVMQTYVTRLRRALGPAGTRIIGRALGWAVKLRGPEEFGLTAVDGRWRAARAAMAAGDWRQVSSLLAGALSLWRGEPLADVPSAALARRELGGFGELRLRLVEVRVDADLHLGRHSELVAELRQLAAEHPLRERLRAQLMPACYRCGQQAAAPEVYRDARETLTDELGIEPGHELREMQQKILTGDPGLTAGTPVPVQAVPGRPPAAPARPTGGMAEPAVLTGLHDGAGGAAEAAAVLPAAHARERALQRQERTFV
jgi:DNA-binding SARP family transcriptional activator